MQIRRVNSNSCRKPQSTQNNPAIYCVDTLKIEYFSLKFEFTIFIPYTVFTFFYDSSMIHHILTYKTFLLYFNILFFIIFLKYLKNRNFEIP